MQGEGATSRLSPPQASKVTDRRSGRRVSSQSPVEAANVELIAGRRRRRVVVVVVVVGHEGERAVAAGGERVSFDRVGGLAARPLWGLLYVAELQFLGTSRARLPLNLPWK